MPKIEKKPFYKESRLRFQCTGCGKCCYGVPGDHYIKVSETERETIRNHLGIGRDWFRRRYLETLAPGEFGIRLNPDGACPFLQRDGNCSIYSLRPGQCRTYPFWPEIVLHRRSWHQESRRCEGINAGEPVAVPTIEKSLSESTE
jgi:Fe-S-cluster containining protein